MATITKYHSLGGLNSRCLFTTVLESGKPKIKVLADLIPDENFLPSLQDGCLLSVFSHGRKREREPLLLKDSSPNTITLGIRLRHTNFPRAGGGVGGTNIQFIQRC